VLIDVDAAPTPAAIGSKLQRGKTEAAGYLLITRMPLCPYTCVAAAGLNLRLETLHV